MLVEVPNDHPLIWTEQMMPVLPITRVRNVDDEGIRTRSPLRGENLGHGDRVEGVGPEAVDRLGGEDHESAGADDRRSEVYL